MEINKRLFVDFMKEYQFKDKEYYKGINWQLFDLVELFVKIIFEVGCVEGLFGVVVKEKMNCFYYGIELYLLVVEKVVYYIDKVIMGDIEILKFFF